MDYEVILTIPAKAQLDHIIDYVLSEYENTQAALGIMDDAEETKYRLSHMASRLKLCDEPRLRDLGYRTIHFKRHNYFMLYRIQDDIVYVDAIYHDLQNYEDIF
ncbi:MAG: type II toxin-antitoxin system RelE/ParE family toxin [Roseburia sp.]|nr:type II toxin-antitoxin system RelE/ParE family toxin [Roseburia sp.]